MAKGGNPDNLPETEGKMKKWATIFSFYQWSRNPRYGNLEFLPASGGLLDQPVKTMEALTILVVAYQNQMNDNLKNISSKIKHR